MKGFVVIFLVVYLALTAESASHHKKHKASKNVKDDAGVSAPGDDAWPFPSSIGDFGVPDKFLEDSGSGQSEEKTVKHLGRSSHKSNSN